MRTGRGGVTFLTIDVSLTSPEIGARRRGGLRRAAIASAIGSSIEWYDFFLYSIATGSVFATLFFPRSDPLTGALKAFAIWGIGVAARPIGAAAFGHFGDRIGRKSTLIATLTLMGIATFLVALVPTYDQIGIWGAVSLTALRFVQGVGVGGEWGGSVLLSMEWTDDARNRGLMASWPQFGVPVGLFLANIVFLCFSRLPGDQFLAWGWRAPFALSLGLVALGIWIRRGVDETPAFVRVVEEAQTARRPTLQAMRDYWPQILLSAFARMAEQVPFYVFTAFVVAYATGVLRVERGFIFWAMTFAACVSFVSIPFFGWLSDRVGRKTMYLTGCAVTGIFGFAYFLLLDSGSYTLIFLAIATSLVPHAMLYGPQAALIAEGFPSKLRYSGASLGYHLASIVAGGPAPIIATLLYRRFESSLAIAVFIFACAIISAIATALMNDQTGRPIDEETSQL
jgi:MFS family permease